MTNYLPTYTNIQPPLDDIINLVEQWLKDDSNYDQEVYPQINSALQKEKIGHIDDLIDLIDEWIDDPSDDDSSYYPHLKESLQNYPISI